METNFNCIPCAVTILYVFGILGQGKFHSFVLQNNLDFEEVSLLRSSSSTVSHPAPEGPCPAEFNSNTFAWKFLKTFISWFMCA